MKAYMARWVDENGDDKDDTIFYGDNSTVEEVRRDLVGHDGYPDDIIVTGPSGEWKSRTEHYIPEEEEESQNWDTNEVSRWINSDESFYLEATHCRDAGRLEGIVRDWAPNLPDMDVDLDEVDFDSLYEELNEGG